MALSPLVDPDSLFSISAPTEKGAIEKIELEISRSLPPLLRDFFGRGSSLVEVSWKAKESVSRELPAELVDGAWGELKLALEEVPALIDEWQEWNDFFEDATFFPGGIQPIFGFEDMFPLRFLTSGDALVMVAKGAQAGELYYLDHEGGEFNWAKLGNSIPNFLETWAGLGCIGPSEYLSYFYDFSQHRFVDGGEVAKSWLARLKANPT